MNEGAEKEGPDSGVVSDFIRNIVISLVLPVVTFLFFLLTFSSVLSLFCSVCVNHQLYEASCSFEHTATCWRRGKNAPL